MTGTERIRACFCGQVERVTGIYILLLRKYNIYISLRRDRLLAGIKQDFQVFAELFHEHFVKRKFSE